MDGQETPPQAWGRPVQVFRSAAGLGNTPTGVGKTTIIFICNLQVEKHPHRRGEDINEEYNAQRATETPPQAWGRPPQLMLIEDWYGNTPTGVGKTESGKCPIAHLQKHPHRRGEDKMIMSDNKDEIETPPQAWGRRGVKRLNLLPFRNTPTGVGKTRRVT